MPSEDNEFTPAVFNFNTKAFISWVESFNWTPEETKGWETFKFMLMRYTGDIDDK